jgi:tRNA(Ile2) C34 agmatinyltransferase TiaS
MARTVKCPSCGAELTVKDDNRDFMFCEFCGTKVRLDDYQETHRYVNEAEVQRVKAEKELELKKMEFEERKRHEEDESYKRFFIGLMTFMAACLLFMVLIGKFC